MSFNLQFNAKDLESAVHKVEDAALPDYVRAIILQALSCVKQDLGVSVIAQGHIHSGEDNDYPLTIVDIKVTPLIFARPRHAVSDQG